MICPSQWWWSAKLPEAKFQAHNIAWPSGFVWIFGVPQNLTLDQNVLHPNCHLLVIPHFWTNPYIYSMYIYVCVYVYTYILIYIHSPLLNGCVSRWFNPPSSEWPLRSAANTGLTQEGHRKTKLNLGRVRKDLQGDPLEQCDTKMGLKRTRQLALMWCILYNTYIHIHIHIQYIHIQNIYILHNYIYIHIHMVQLPETLMLVGDHNLLTSFRSS